MSYIDPDTYVAWTRIEEPGDYPTWESQCGRIVQTNFNPPTYDGYVGTSTIPLSSVTNFTSLKKQIEREFTKTHELSFAHSAWD